MLLESERLRGLRRRCPLLCDLPLRELALLSETCDRTERERLRDRDRDGVGVNDREIDRERDGVRDLDLDLDGEARLRFRRLGLGERRLERGEDDRLRS